MSKAQMARELVALGCPKSFNTLRGYSVDTLEAMLHHAKVDAHMARIAAEDAAQCPHCGDANCTRNHVTGAIERGEATPIEQIPVPQTTTAAYIPTDAEFMALRRERHDNAVARDTEVVQSLRPRRRWFDLALLPLMAVIGLIAGR